jgi:SPP1 family predicted phage head-tail adaptor
MTVIGTLRHRLFIGAPEETADSAGGVVRTWTALATVWAAIEPLGASDALVADKHLGALTHRIRLRPRTELTLNHRLRLGARVYLIRALREIEDGRLLECLVAEERP